MNKLTTPGKAVKEKKGRVSATAETTECARRKAATSGTMEDSVAAELKTVSIAMKDRRDSLAFTKA